MKIRCLLLVFILLLAACSRRASNTYAPQLTRQVDTVKSAALLVYQSHSAPGDNETAITRLREFAEEFGLEFIMTADSVTRFLIQDGTVIEIKRYLQVPECDFVIFDAQHTPVSGVFARIDDAFVAFSGKRRLKHEKKYRARAAAQNKMKNQSFDDPAPARSTEMPLISGRPKVIVVPFTDTAQVIHMPAMRPGIQWVFQQVDHRKYLSFFFENDLLTIYNTDRYYTNGVGVEWHSPRLANWFLHTLMVPYRHPAFVEYSAGLWQQMFTSTDTRIAPLLNTDRPFASVLVTNYSRGLTDYYRRIKLKTGITLGYIGPHSAGAYLQDFVHRTFPTNDVPLGWETQIKTDLILNYMISLSKPVITRSRFSLNVGMDASIGTLYDMAGVTVSSKAGWFRPEYLLAQPRLSRSTECYFYSEAALTGVGYNALLQGGMLNKDNVFTLEPSEITRFTSSLRAGIIFSHNGYALEMSQQIISPEYKGGLWHKWGRVGVTFRL